MRSKGAEGRAVKIALSPHDPTWASSFDRIDAQIRDVLGDDALTVEHVGSTAVPGLLAKAVIDVLLVVADSTCEQAYREPLRKAEFEFQLREPAWHEHRLFKRTDPTSNLHVFSAGCPEIERMLRFRDLLRSHPSSREAYQSRKRELATMTWESVQEYADAKASTVESLLASTGGSDTRQR